MLNSFRQFQKVSSSTQQYNSLSSSSFDFVESFDELDLEQTCLVRLKKQRQKIQQLTALYQQSQKQLLKKNQQHDRLHQQIEHLTEMQSYKSHYQELSRQHQALTKKFQISQSQLNSFRRQLEEVSTGSNSQAIQLRKQIKHLKEQKLLSDASWTALLTDKEDQLKQQIRHTQQRQYENGEKIQALYNKIELLEEAFAEQSKELQSNKEEFREELCIRDQNLANFQKIIESFKKQNGQYKCKIINMQDSFGKQQQQYQQALEQCKNHLKILKKDQNEKENQIYQSKQIIKKFDMKNQALESTVESLKSNLKKLKTNNDTSFKKISSNNQDQRCRLQLFIDELKNEVQRQMQDNSLLTAELKRVKGYIQRKQQQQRQRKLLLMSEFREIDKMDKMVSKVI